PRLLVELGIVPPDLGRAALKAFTFHQRRQVDVATSRNRIRLLVVGEPTGHLSFGEFRALGFLILSFAVDAPEHFLRRLRPLRLLYEEIAHVFAPGQTLI